jgi:competence protein ComEC
VANPPLILVVLVTLAFFMLLHADKRAWRNAFFLISVVIIMMIILPAEEDDRSLMVTFLDVGQGDAAFLRFPNHRTMLIDAGGADRNWDNGTATILPFLKKNGTLKLDYLVASHAHDDHVGGFPALLRSIEIDTVVLNAYPYHSKRFKLIRRLCRERGIPILTAARGDRICADPSCRVYVLHPDSVCAAAHNFSGSECNNSSLVLKVQYGEMGLLFTGDLEKSAEPRIIMYGDFLESEILKIAHHGSSTSTSDDLLKQTNPVIAIVPVGLKNKFRHPSPKTLARLHERYIRVYRTSHTGAVMFRIMPGYIEKIAWRSRSGGW